MASVILCIDDREQVLALRQANLTRAGYSVLVATSGAAAIKTSNENPVDLVLLEYKEEGIDAEAVAFHLKGSFPQIPIILLSAYSDMSERILWLVDEFVMKSVHLEELVQTIRKTIRGSIKITEQHSVDCLAEPQGGEDYPEADQCAHDTSFGGGHLHEIAIAIFHREQHLFLPRLRRSRTA